MFCSKCGSQVEEGYKFCLNCGNPVEVAVEPVTDMIQEDAGDTFHNAAQDIQQQQAYGHQAYTQQPYQNGQPYQQQVYAQPNGQQMYQQPYVQPVYNQQVYQQNPAPVKRTNGPGVAGLVFGILTLVLFGIAALAFTRAWSMIYGYSYYYSIGGLGAIAGMCYGFGCILFIFNLIFGIIGFARGLKTKIKMAAGIIGFVLIFINLILLIWEAGRYVGFLISFLS